MVAVENWMKICENCWNSYLIEVIFDFFLVFYDENESGRRGERAASFRCEKLSRIGEKVFLELLSPMIDV